MKYNWRAFMVNSDARYKEALSSGDITALASHNLLQGMDVEFRFLENLLARALNIKLSGANVLDVCCGIGELVRYLNSIDMEAVGFDLNEDAIKLAKLIDPKGTYFVSDATNVCKEVRAQTYDLIMIREAHPYTRIHDDEFQLQLTEDYLSMLKPGGALVIAHAQGKTVKEPSVSLRALCQHFGAQNYQFAGPYMLYLYKHLHFKYPPLWVITILSFMSHRLSDMLNLRLISYFVLKKPLN